MSFASVPLGRLTISFLLAAFVIALATIATIASAMSVDCASDDREAWAAGLVVLYVFWPWLLAFTLPMTALTDLIVRKLAANRQATLVTGALAMTLLVALPIVVDAGVAQHHLRLGSGAPRLSCWDF